MLEKLLCTTALVFLVSTISVSSLTRTDTLSSSASHERAPCKESVCASIVSKCLLIDACKCKCGANSVSNCSCARNCYQCLDFLFTDCCDCVKMCPSDSFGAHQEQTSQVGDLPDPFPVLFKALTDDVDPTLRWISYVFVESNHAGQEANVISTETSNSATTTTTTTTEAATSGISQPTVVPSNCTVAYMSQCLSWNKCRESCSSVGAAKYRWFHDGCCECVGSTCFGYGLSQPKCLDCYNADNVHDADDAGDNSLHRHRLADLHQEQLQAAETAGHAVLRKSELDNDEEIAEHISFPSVTEHNRMWANAEEAMSENRDDDTHFARTS